MRGFYVQLQSVSQRRIIWFALLTSTFIYAGILSSLERSWPQPGAFADSVRKPMITGIYIATAVNFIAALIIPRMFSQERPRFILRLAFFETCTVFGLMAALLAQDWRLFIAPWALSLMGFARQFPSE